MEWLIGLALLGVVAVAGFAALTVVLAVILKVADMAKKSRKRLIAAPSRR